MNKVKVLKEEGELGVYLLELPYYIVNSLRRIIIEELPTLRIEDVYIKKNYSHLYDEMLAHRLGLLVIKAKDRNLNEVKLYLKEKGPKMVYAKDIKVEEDKKDKVEILYPETPIVYLDNEFHEIDLEMVAKWGIGKDHIKFKPAHVWFKYYPIIKQKKEKLSEDDVKILKRKFPEGLIEVKDGKVEIKEDKILDYDIPSFLDDRDVENILEYRGDENRIIFYIESFGDYTPREILKLARDIFLRKLDEFESKISNV